MDVDTIKTTVEVYDVLDLYKIRYKNRGAEEQIFCPFHEESVASCRIYPDVNKLHCFGECSRSFDVLDIVQEIEGCSLTEAIKLLQEHFGIQELRAGFTTKFWRNLEGVKKHNQRRQRLDLAFVMAKEAIAKYWPRVDFGFRSLWSEFDDIVERLRSGEDETTDRLRVWYNKAVRIFGGEG